MFIKELPEQAETDSFRAIARVQRNAPKAKRQQAPRTLRVLMDPGAELNLIRKSLLKGEGKNSELRIHATQPDNLVLMNNGKEVARVSEAVFLSFVLDTQHNVALQTYHEWFHVLDDMEEEMLLGSAFCKAQSFTNFHNRLVPYTNKVSNKDTFKRETHHLSQEQPLRYMPLVEYDDRPGEGEGEGYTNASAVRAITANIPEEEQPLLRTREHNFPRERVTTGCEKIDAHRAKHKRAHDEEEHEHAACDYVAGRRVKRKQIAQRSPVTKSHINHTPVVYNNLQTRQIASLLCRRTIDEQKKLHKQLQKLAASKVALTMQEAETLRDTAQMCAQEAADFFAKNQSALNKEAAADVWGGKRSRYFIDVDPDPPHEHQQSEQKGSQRFHKGQCIMLQNLINHPELNGKPARVVSYDAETQLYAISVATPRGYWHAKEDKLKPLDPPREPDDFKSCGIDPASGQPTLDPLDKPIHRQYGKQYSESLTKAIAVLLERYKDVFGKDISKPCKFRPMKIQLVPNAKLPANPRYWKNSPAQRQEVRTQLQSMLSMNVVRGSSTAVVSNVLLVKRPGMPGKFRFTIDFRDLNDATVATPLQMPEVQSQLDRLSGGNCIFGCIDLSSYYHQIELDEGSRFLTGFITEDGVFEYNRVAMGLKGACAHAQGCLQRAIDADPILSKYGLRNYFDDLPLAAKREEEFLEQLEAILKLGVRENLKFNLEKSIFGVDSITHVGFVVNAKGVQVDPQRLDSLRDIAVPKTMRGVQSVLGMWNYIRHFIPHFSTLALPLTNLVGSKKKAKQFVWTQDCQQAFDTLKQATLNTELLANIDYTLPIFIRCDSSQYGAGAVLFQFDELGRERPISYASRKYTMAERNYCTFQQEAAAVVWSLEKFSNFHQGHHVTVQSDHKNLSWIKRTAMPQLTRWRLRLQDFDFSLEYFEGSRNVVADGLSRKCVDDADIDISMRDFLPEHVTEQSFLQGTLPMRCLNEYSVFRTKGGARGKTAAEQVWEGSATTRSSPDLNDLEGVEFVKHTQEEDADEPELHGEVDSTKPATQTLFAPLQRQEQEEPPPIPQLDADQESPPSRELTEPEKVISQMHNEVVGHNGVLVTLNRVLRADKQWASRQEMLAEIDQFISGCAVCQKFRKRHNRRTDQRFVISGNPFSELSVDVLKLPKRDCNGNLYVVVIVDSFTRWVSLEAVPDKSALSAARAIIRTIGCFGVPLTIRSDGGREFINDLLASVEHVLGTKHHKMMPYHHEGNSLAEKANRSVLENLRNLIFDKRYRLNGEHQWSDLLPLVQRVMNASFNSSIGCSPAALVFGNNIDLDRCLISAAPPLHDSVDVPDYVRTLTHNQQVLLEAADQHLRQTHASNLAKWKNTHTTNLELQQHMQNMRDDPTLQPWVLVRLPTDAPNAKWHPRWTGPFRLLDWKTNSQSVVRVYDTVKQTTIEAHINDVALWNTQFVDSVEGLKAIAETDGWQYPIDGIVGIALNPEDDDVLPIALPLDQRRTVSNKHKYLFAVKWRGYAEPSWEPWTSVQHTSSLELFAQAHPALKLV
jgi:hypothetical protein